MRALLPAKMVQNRLLSLLDQSIVEKPLPLKSNPIHISKDLICGDANAILRVVDVVIRLGFIADFDLREALGGVQTESLDIENGMSGHAPRIGSDLVNLTQATELHIIRKEVVVRGCSRGWKSPGDR